MGSQALAMRYAGKEREQHLRTVHASLDSERADRKSPQVASEGRHPLVDPSHTTVRRIWTTFGLQPQRSETFKLSTGRKR